MEFLEMLLFVVAATNYSASRRLGRQAVRTGELASGDQLASFHHEVAKCTCTRVDQLPCCGNGRVIEHGDTLAARWLESLLSFD
ncbi:MAG: hypothetical protein U5N53_17730 [Mycobacterium sp.]|nr:hypothetical protein [Mycobacterium sp.]